MKTMIAAFILILLQFGGAHAAAGSTPDRCTPWLLHSISKLIDKSDALYDVSLETANQIKDGNAGRWGTLMARLGRRIDMERSSVDDAAQAISSWRHTVNTTSAVLYKEAQRLRADEESVKICNIPTAEIEKLRLLVELLAKHFAVLDHQLKAVEQALIKLYQPVVVRDDLLRPFQDLAAQCDSILSLAGMAKQTLPDIRALFLDPDKLTVIDGASEEDRDQLRRRLKDDPDSVVVLLWGEAGNNQEILRAAKRVLAANRTTLRDVYLIRLRSPELLQSEQAKWYRPGAAATFLSFARSRIDKSLDNSKDSERRVCGFVEDGNKSYLASFFYKGALDALAGNCGLD